MKLTRFQKDAIVRAIFQDVPVAKAEDIKTAIQAELVKAMSPECRRLYKKSPHALRSSATYYKLAHRETLRFVVGDLTQDQEAAILQPWVDARKNYEEVKDKLTRTVDGCSTLKQLTELLPEFVSYFPVEGKPTSNLPVVANLVADLVKLGWKGAEGAAA